MRRLPRPLRDARATTARASFASASALASEHGLILLECAEGRHYHLRERNPDGFILNIYPERSRLVAEESRPRPPYLKPFLVGPGASSDLLAVVRAAVEARLSRRRR